MTNKKKKLKYLVVIPARGGSKGIPHKNIYPLAGKPLIEYAIESIENVIFDGDVVVSTDDEMIMNVVSKYSEVIIIRRPDEISGDTASTEDALIHSLDYMKNTYSREYDAVITLQATSPLRKSATIQKFIDEFEDNSDRFDAYLTLTEDRSDFWIKNGDGIFQRIDPKAPRRRQEREPLYVENSAIYVTSVDSLRETHSVLGNNVNGFIIDYNESVDINELADIALAESLLTKERVI